MSGVFTAKTAVFFHFDPVGIVLFVFHRIVISLFAVIACKRNPDSHLPYLLKR